MRTKKHSSKDSKGVKLKEVANKAFPVSIKVGDNLFRIDARVESYYAEYNPFFGSLVKVGRYRPKNPLSPRVVEVITYLSKMPKIEILKVDLQKHLSMRPNTLSACLSYLQLNRSEIERDGVVYYLTVEKEYRRVVVKLLPIK